VIKVLSDNLINKIAAGEVIDRPSSVVKELVENAIDAEARQITVILKNGGKSLIQIIDDGIGMDEQNAILSFQRHATSKISSYRDIEHITTLGFRGEALASIAAVARVELRTVPRNTIEGTRILMQGGVMQTVDKTGGNAGTSISVKNIFFNTPARRKFLRADNTEYRHILSVFNRFALCHPDIDFTLINDDRQVTHLTPTPLLQRISKVLGNRVIDQMLEVADDNALVKIGGYIGNYDLMRKSRNDQYIFLNHRYIVDRTINYAIVSAFGDLIPRGHYPLYVLFLEIDPERVDVNVHPTKSEVKFADQQMLYTLVRGAIKRALVSEDGVPEIKLDSDTVQVDASEMTGWHKPQRPALDELRSFSSEQTRIDFDAPTDPEQSRMKLDGDWQAPKASSTPFPVTPTPKETSPSLNSGVLVWQMHNRYILSQIKSGLVIIDQHLAHRRILYEKAKSSFAAQNSGSSQQLLFPHTIDLSAEDFEHLMSILPFLEKIGFIVKGFGGQTVVVEGVPGGMRVGDEGKILFNILDEYKKNAGNEVDIQEAVAKSFAARSAISAGEKLSTESMNALIDQLFATQEPYFCPYGRPTMITMTIDELERRFEKR
jgi:DNA mismatch repair protein MutL